MRIDELVTQPTTMIMPQLQALSLTVHDMFDAPPMCDFSITMDDGTEISGCCPSKAALRTALEMLMSELELVPFR